MPYKNILSGYVNKRKDDEGFYLVITNMSDDDVVIKPGEKVYMNRTPEARLKEYPTIPHYSKSEKIEEEKTHTAASVSEDIPL